MAGRRRVRMVEAVMMAARVVGVREVRMGVRVRISAGGETVGDGSVHGRGKVVGVVLVVVVGDADGAGTGLIGAGRLPVWPVESGIACRRWTFCKFGEADVAERMTKSNVGVWHLML